MTESFDWNDLKYLLAVADHGSTLAAARALGVNQSTVQRRLAELERGLHQPLVTRQPSGYRLTEFGQQLLPAARRVEQAVQDLVQQVAQPGRDAAGVLRVTCPEPLVQRLTHSPLLERFAARHPGLRIVFVMSDKYLDLAQGEADVALRSGDTDDGELLGRKIGDSHWALYASTGYVARHGSPADVAALAHHALVGFDDSMAEHRAARWLAEVVPQARVAARNSSVLGLLQSATGGLGVAPLPTAIGDSAPGLVRVLGPIPELTRIWRVLAHPNVRHSQRVSAFFDFIVDEIDTLRPIFGG